MILATVTVVNARTGFPDHVGDLLIYNTGTGDAERGNYRCRLDDEGWELRGFDRGRGALALVGEAIRQRPGEER